MRHLMMGGMLGGGFAGFLLMRMIRRVVMGLVLLLLVGVIFVLWVRLQQEKYRNRLPPGWQ